LAHGKLPNTCPRSLFIKTAHLPKKRRPPFGYIYPVFCGLVVGGMLGGLMHSFFMFALFGGITWLYFYLDFFHVLPAGGVPVARDEIDDGFGRPINDWWKSATGRADDPVYDIGGVLRDL
jgi:hypothetical protein